MVAARDAGLSKRRETSFKVQARIVANMRVIVVCSRDLHAPGARTCARARACSVINGVAKQGGFPVVGFARSRPARKWSLLSGEGGTARRNFISRVCGRSVQKQPCCANSAGGTRTAAEPTAGCACVVVEPVGTGVSRCDCVSSYACAGV